MKELTDGCAASFIHTARKKALLSNSSMFDQVAKHYDGHDLITQLKAALTRSGLDGKVLSASDVAPLDQFHTRGLAATAELAERITFTKNTSVLDIGSGLGGPSRYLADTFGCEVTGVDLSQSFVDAANFLAEKSGLAAKVTYQCANALALPFASASFDVVWTQHVAMNISDRGGLYTEVDRVLKPGGHFAIYDIVAGNGTPLHFPVPWARTDETSFLLSAEDMKAVLVATGFEIISWENCTDAAMRWFTELKQSLSDPVENPKRLGLDTVMGPDFKTMAGNLALNFQEGRVGVIEAVIRKLA